VKKLVTQEFTRQGYLEFTKLPNCDQPVFEVRWGQRALLETSKVQILKFVSLVSRCSRVFMAVFLACFFFCFVILFFLFFVSGMLFSGILKIMRLNKRRYGILHYSKQF
jgi:hypothetical protein